MCILNGSRSSYLVVGSPDYLARRGTPRHPSGSAPARLHRLPAHAPIHHYRWAFAAEGELLEIEVTGPLTTSTPALYLGAAEAGLGLAYCHEGGVRRSGIGAAGERAG